MHGPDYFRALAENSADIICYVSPDAAMEYISPSCTRILGWLPEELRGVTPDFLVHPEDLPRLQFAAQQNRMPGREPAPLTVRVRRRAGGYLWIESTARAVHEPETGEIARMVLVMRDVTERKQAEEALRTLAVTDGLTGLQNRRAFDEALEDAWRETLLTGSQMALLMFDIDYFKRLNDSYGHLAGDDCLRAIAEVIKRTLPKAGCVAARYGGEELAVILRDADAEAAMQIAEAIRAGVQALRVPHRSCHEGGGFVSVSVGVAVAVSRHGGSMRMPESLLLSADNALYKAKRNGRNRLALSLVVASKAS